MNVTPELTIERQAEEEGGWVPGEVSTGTTIVAAQYVAPSCCCQIYLCPACGCGRVVTAPVTERLWLRCRYDGGVVLGADSRVTTGTYVSNRASDKITHLCDNVYLCRSGTQAPLGEAPRV